MLMPVILFFHIAVSSVCQHDRWCHLNLRKSPLVGGGLSIVIEERQTPSCCVGDSLKECQRKHSQTTCSPRAGGLAALQAHLHTIPQLLASRAKEGEQSSQTERTCLLCDGSISDESDDIVGKQWEDACSAGIKRTLVLYPNIILWMPYLQMYICITAPSSHAEICLTTIGLYTATLCMCFIALIGHTMPVFLHILLTHSFSNRRAHIMTLRTPFCVWHFP